MTPPVERLGSPPLERLRIPSQSGRHPSLTSRPSTPTSGTSAPCSDQITPPLLGFSNPNTTQDGESSDPLLANVNPYEHAYVPVHAQAPHMSQFELDTSRSKESPVPQLPTDWVPYTLRWWYISSLAFFIFALIATIIALLVVSQQNDGLGTDDGSDAVLFGWRFMPTLLAVAYAQLTSMLFEDVRRIEPFALLACATRAKASSTLLQRSDAWWAVLRKSLKRQNRGRSWALFCACLLHVIAFLTIAPLSSSVLTSMDVEIQSDVPFSSWAPKADSVMPLQPQGDTFFRTISNLLQNVTTSAWITENHLIFPSWPAAMPDTPLGARFTDVPQSWQTQSIVYQVQYNCRDVHIAGVQNITQPVPGRDYPEYPISVEFQDDHGCSFIMDLEAQVGWELLLRGGTFWSNILPSKSFPGKTTFKNDVKSGCGENMDIIFLSTPWSRTRGLGAFRLRTDTKTSARICESNFYAAEMPLIIDSSQAGIQTRITFDQASFEQKKTDIASPPLNITAVRSQLLDAKWSDYLSQPLRVADVASTTRDPSVHEGAAAALGTFYNWNASVMINASDITERAQQIQHRLFSELVQISASQPDASNTISGTGKVIQTERRVVVVHQLAIVLVSLLGVSLVLVLLVCRMTRLSQRPLNLQQDPATAVGLASVLPRITPHPKLFHLSKASRKDIDTTLRETKYRLMPTTVSNQAAAVEHEEHHRSSAFQSNWKPTPLRIWSLASLIGYLIALQVAVLVLYHYSSQSKLYKTFFVFQATVRVLSSGTFAPYSILPTLFAVIVGLWWDTIDKTVRRLQPYLSMSSQPTRIDSGSGLSYQSSYLAWAASKAARKKHWILAMVGLGSMICKILVIAMSALFARQHGVFLHTVEANRLVEPRQIPYLNHEYYNNRLQSGGGGKADIPGRILTSLFSNAQTNWMYSATIQLALDGIEPPWSKEGWSFTPVALPDLPDVSNASNIQNLGTARASTQAINVTMSTQAMKARLDCSAIPETNDTSTWLEEVPLEKLQNSSRSTHQDRTAYDLTSNMFSFDYTSLLTHPGRISCCLNASTGQYPQPLAVGYWSSTGDVQRWPNANRQWPMNLTVKWLRGPAAPWPTELNLSRLDENGYYIPRSKFMFTEVPSLQALNCRPVIELAEADVTVDYTTGVVQDFTILGEPQPNSQPWSDPFVERGWNYIGDPRDDDMGINTEFTTSYGIMFLNALIGASDLAQLRGSPATTLRKRENRTDLDSTAFLNEWNITDNTFKIRDTGKGLNLDLMTYSMYTLAGKDPDALLNATTMLLLAQKTFETYFQHFVSTNREPNATMGAYQLIGAELNSTLLDKSRELWAGRDEVPGYQLNTDWKPQYSYPKLNTSRTVNGTVSTRVEMLRMSSAATWVSAVSLAWLICTTVVLLLLQRKYLGNLIRDIESIADVLTLVAGSESLLKLISETDPRELVKNKQICTKLGWFRARNGQVRWGIEVVGDVGLGPVEWLDGPIGVVWEKEEQEKDEKSRGLKTWFRRS